MVDNLGHAAFGLLFALPAWFLWEARTSIAFVGLATIAAVVPDVDLFLAQLFPAEIHHHGVVHTVLFITISSAILAGVLAVVFDDQIESLLRNDRFDSAGLFGFLFGALLVGGLSHLVADMLSAPDISTPIEPFWPFFDKPWSVDLVWYDAMWVNLGFFSVMVVTHLVVSYFTTSPKQRLITR
ncbi:metal-dependent hydrolase [Haloferax namakaokahaiae]|uniref:Metal-dependent hydrolase n=1 Tax=Haloferax namakaokahaiae TaxID=1748331 RepID=A0ABD5ZDA1_9EURY